MTDSKFLLVTATAFEVQPTLDHFAGNAQQLERLGAPGTCFEYEGFDCLVTGVGQLQCAAQLMARLTIASYGAVVQAGLAGSFSPLYPKRTVVRVREEVLGDFGAEADGSFLDMGDMGLFSRDHFPFRNGVLSAVEPDDLKLDDLPQVRSVTVNRTLADPKSIEWVRQRFAPDIVNMEGAALFYVCLLQGVPFVELRAVSDMVGPRDKASWDLDGSIAALNRRLIELFVAHEKCPIIDGAAANAKQEQ